MGLRNTQQVGQFQRFEANDIGSFEQALEDSLGVIDGQGLGAVIGEPEIIIVLRTTGRAIGNDKLIDATIYIGALPSEVAADLNTLIA